jgi:hypothetical protein
MLVHRQVLREDDYLKARNPPFPLLTAAHCGLRLRLTRPTARNSKESSECRALSGKCASRTRCFIGTIFNAFDLPETMTINAADLAR